MAFLRFGEPCGATGDAGDAGAAGAAEVFKLMPSEHGELAHARKEGRYVELGSAAARLPGRVRVREKVDDAIVHHHRLPKRARRRVRGGGRALASAGVWAMGVSRPA